MPCNPDSIFFASRRSWPAPPVSRRTATCNVWRGSRPNRVSRHHGVNPRFAPSGYSPTQGGESG